MFESTWASLLQTYFSNRLNPILQNEFRICYLKINWMLKPASWYRKWFWQQKGFRNLMLPQLAMSKISSLTVPRYVRILDVILSLFAQHHPAQWYQNVKPTFRYSNFAHPKSNNTAIPNIRAQITFPKGHLWTNQPAQRHKDVWTYSLSHQL